jgi:cyclopropane fatty-acyl-phospholipid synthase-like methyltransferase
MKVLDIGSALGFFLKAAGDLGAENVVGVEISAFASNYCKKKFGYKTINLSFEDFTAQEKYDVITTWFFIEHCEDVFGVMKKIYNMLNDGGVFACSLPSIYGPQFIFEKEKWSSEHPIDHKIDFSPKSICKILKAYGYSKIRIKSSGFHPERIIKKSNFLYFPFCFVYKCFTKITGFSDMMEVYAIK